MVSFTEGSYQPPHFYSPYHRNIKVVDVASKYALVAVWSMMPQSYHFYNPFSTFKQINQCQEGCHYYRVATLFHTMNSRIFLSFSRTLLAWKLTAKRIHRTTPRQLQSSIASSIHSLRWKHDVI